jgi:general secretion pathway protein J
MTARVLPSKPKPGNAGFTLFEALVSVALMGLIVAALSAVTGQWAPNWHRGFGNVQRLESFDLGLRRVVADLASAEFVTANGASKTPLFLGEALSVTLVRRAFGPDATPHLEMVNFAETADERGFALVRTRAPFVPLAANVPIATQLHLADPVALIRAPFRVSFSYAGPDRLWRDSWSEQQSLPSAVRVLVRDAATGRALSLSTATLLHVDLAAECVAGAAGAGGVAGAGGAGGAGDQCPAELGAAANSAASATPPAAAEGAQGNSAAGAPSPTAPGAPSPTAAQGQ